MSLLSRPAASRSPTDIPLSPAQRPELVAIDAKIAHAAKKLKSASANAESVERDLEAGEEKLDGLKKDLEGVEKAQKRSKGERIPQEMLFHYFH